MFAVHGVSNLMTMNFNLNRSLFQANTQKAYSHRSPLGKLAIGPHQNEEQLGIHS